jgi:hypothetical protein
MVVVHILAIAHLKRLLERVLSPPTDKVQVQGLKFLYLIILLAASIVIVQLQIETRLFTEKRTIIITLSLPLFVSIDGNGAKLVQSAIPVLMQAPLA